MMHWNRNRTMKQRISCCRRSWRNRKILESAILILKPLLGNEETGPDVYRALVRMMIENGQIREAEDLLKDCSREIRRACGEYICEPPTVKLSPGTYTSVQSLEMESDDGEIYYTMDGTIPTEKSQKYSKNRSLFRREL